VSAWELHTGDKQGGPYTDAQIIEAIERGLKATVVVRQVGSEEWKSLRTHPPFAMALERVSAASQPPPISATAPMGSPIAPKASPPKQSGESRVVGMLIVGAVTISLVIWAISVVKPTPLAPPVPPNSTPVVPVAPAAPSDPTREFAALLASKKTLPEALAITKPLMGDEYNQASAGAKFLTVWSATNLTWASSQPPADETSIGLVMKDPDEQRGKRLCAPGTIVQITVNRTDLGPIGEGLMITEAGNIISYLAVRSTGDLVEQSVARFCGIVTGKYDYPNSGGGTGHAVQMVGMFDLPENRAR